MAPASSRKTSRRRTWIALVVTVLVLVALTVLAIVKLNPAAVGRILSHVKLGWAGLALALMAAAFFMRAESWYAVIRAAIPGNDLGRAPVRRGLMIGMVGSTVAPGRLGEAARAWVVARRLGDPARNVAVVVGTIVSQTLMNLVALAILAAITLLGTALSSSHSTALIGALAVPVVLVALALLAPRALHRAARARSSRLRRSAAWISRQLLQFRRGFVVFGHPRAALHAGGTQMLAWALQVASCYVTILALSLQDHATLIAAAAVLLAVNITAIVPITPSNVGVFQAACIAVLAPFGVSASEGLAYGLLLQAIEIVTAFVLGVPALLREGLPLAELRRQARKRLADAPESP